MAAIEFNPEKMPACIAHAFIPNCFWCESKKDFVQYRELATKYVGAKARESGFESIKRSYPNATMKHLIYEYFLPQ